MAIRDIIFRGKRFDNGEWVESWSLRRTKDKDGNVRAFLGTGQNAVFVFDTYRNIIAATALEEALDYSVDPSTVGQFTGLCDKNGKKIFEGDIVKPLRYASSINSTELVEYDGGGFSPFAIPGWECTIEPCNVAVIGNKWDNPELLEGEG